MDLYHLPFAIYHSDRHATLQRCVAPGLRAARPRRLEHVFVRSLPAAAGPRLQQLLRRQRGGELYARVPERLRILPGHSGRAWRRGFLRADHAAGMARVAFADARAAPEARRLHLRPLDSGAGIRALPGVGLVREARNRLRVVPRDLHRRRRTVCRLWEWRGCHARGDRGQPAARPSGGAEATGTDARRAVRGVCQCPDGVVPETPLYRPRKPRRPTRPRRIRSARSWRSGGRSSPESTSPSRWMARRCWSSSSTTISAHRAARPTTATRPSSRSSSRAATSSSC